MSDVYNYNNCFVDVDFSSIGKMTFTKGDNSTYVLELDNNVRDLNALKTVTLTENSLKFLKDNGDSIIIDLSNIDFNGFDDVLLNNGILFFYNNDKEIKNIDIKTLIINELNVINPITNINIVDSNLVIKYNNNNEKIISLSNFQDKDVLKTVNLINNQLTFTKQNGEFSNIDLSLFSSNEYNIEYDENTYLLKLIKNDNLVIEIDLSNLNNKNIITSEISNRISSDLSLYKEINNIKTLINSGDNALLNSIKNEISNRISSETSLQTNINTETATRIEFNNLLLTKIDNEIFNRENSDKNIISLINNENNNSLSTSLTEEKFNRIKNDESLSSNIIYNNNDRISSELSFNSEIDNVKTNIKIINTSLENISIIENNVNNLSTKIENSLSNNIIESNRLSISIIAESSSRKIIDDLLIDKIETSENSLSCEISKLKNQGIDTSIITEEISNRISSEKTLLSTFITNESVLKTEINNTFTKMIIDEKVNRLSVDNSLSTSIMLNSLLKVSTDENFVEKINNQTNQRISNESIIYETINNEKNERITIDNSLSTSIKVIQNDYINSNKLSSAIKIEESNRINSERSLINDINKNLFDKTNEIQNISNLLSVERNERLSSDSNILYLMDQVKGNVSPDASYSETLRISTDLSLLNNINIEISNRISNDIYLSASILEVTDKLNVNDIDLKKEIENNNKNLENELSIRISNDLSLSDLISTETSIRSVFDNILLTKITNEENLRKITDNSLSTTILKFSNDKIDNTLVINEMSIRKSTDTLIFDVISGETIERKITEKSLLCVLNDEITSRIFNENSLSSVVMKISIDTLNNDNTSLKSFNELKLDVYNEISIRKSTDLLFNDILNDETNIRIDNEKSLLSLINNEIYEIVSGQTSVLSIVNKLSSDVITTDIITTEISNRIYIESSIIETINTEKSVRGSVDTSLSTYILNEFNNRYTNDTSLSTEIHDIKYDTTLTNAISFEIDERKINDSLLSDEIDKLSTSLKTDVDFLSCELKNNENKVEIIISGISSDFNNNLSTEIFNRISSDKSLASYLNTESSSKSLNESSISIDLSLRKNAESSLSSQIYNLNSSEISNRISSDRSILNKFNSTITTSGGKINGFLGINTNALYPLHVSGTTMGTSIYATGDIVAFSDQSVKTNLEIIPNAINKIKLIHGYTYERSDINDGIRRAGVIAQEIDKVLPEVVTTNADGTKAVAYQNMTALLIQGIKEQQDIIEKQQRMIEELQYQINEIKKS